ncbi:hypothetical protein Goe25_00290 [Bacillus phage vB_BsuM-Goe25]|nr:hypothetical protein Goe25_00290 [Bacillus phage vB_BsuM-Goe25]
MADTYKNYAELAAAEEEGKSYRILAEFRGNDIVFFSPHAGGIEVGCTELVEDIVKQTGDSYYLFEGLLPSGNQRLHITSTNFDEPRALELIPLHEDAVSFHGYNDNLNKNTLVGGLNIELRNLIIKHLNNIGIPAEVATDRFTAKDPKNIVNRCASGKGVQLEISSLQRKAFFKNNDWSKGNRDNITEEFLDYVDAVIDAVDEYYE